MRMRKAGARHIFGMTFLFVAGLSQGLAADGVNSESGKDVRNDQLIDFNRCVDIPKALGKKIKRGKILLFGEMHGTWEIPASLADAICAAKRKNIPLQVGFEYDQSSSDALNDFVNSEGSEDDRGELFQKVEWNASFQDGTYSVAMFELLDVLRGWNNGENRISVFGFDNDENTTRAREAKMANRVESAADQEGVVLVLTGNYHSRTRSSGESDSAMRMGQILRSSGLDVVSIEMHTQGGTVWICRGPEPDDCGVARGTVPSAWEKDFKAMPDSHHHDFRWTLGPATAAPPAVEAFNGTTVAVP